MKTKLQFISLFLGMFLLLFGENILGQIASGTYTIGTTGAEDYASLKEACDSINSQGLGGDVTLLIRTDLTEPDNVGLIQPSVHTLTIKPAPDKTPTIYFNHSTDNGGPSGGWILGITDPDDWATVGECKNIIIDGSNNGTDSKDLTLTNGSSAHKYTFPLVFLGNVSNVIVKNCNVITANTVTKGIYVRTNSSDYPHDIVVDNCNITANTSWDGAAVYFYYHTDHSSYTTNFELKNSTLFARHRGVFLWQSEDITIHDNEIKINQTGTGALSHGIYAYTQMPSTADINIYNNKFTQLYTNNATAGNYGIRAIECAYSNVHYNVYNNFIAGFSTTTTASNPSCQVIGIYAHSYNYVNVYNNTIFLPDLQTNFGAGKLDMRGISFYHSPKTLKNNIIYLEEADDTAYCVYQAGSTTLTSDYNDWFVKDAASSKGHVGYYISGPCKDLAEWRDSTSQDANSVSKTVNFVDASNADLHLTGASLGDADLAGVALSAVTTDIDGDTRHDPPYMGADENATPAPVELTTFTAEIVDDGVMLNWSTATEVNNYGFEIEKSVNGGEWEYVDFVEGHGNSNSPQEYSYFDDAAIEGKVAYRLKQVDNNGDYEYSSEVSVLSDEAVYKLNQNYPNPFNPTTVISFSLKASSKITLTVYNALGQEVAVLANEVMDAGYHEVTFDASGLASGFYVYRLDAPGFSKTMKMMLLK